MICNICGYSALQVETPHTYDTRFGYPDPFRILHCPHCDFRQTNPTLSDEALGALYTDYYPRRTMNHEAVKKGADLRNGTLATLRRWFGGTFYKCFYHVPPHTRVLDIGCGNGQSLLFLKAHGVDACGIEEDRNVLPLAEALNLRIEAGNIYHSHYPDHSFDYVLASQVLEHIPDPIRFLKTAAQKLAPGGKMILSFPNTRSLTRWIFGKRWIHWHIPYHLNHFSPKNLPLLFKAAGLRYEGYKTITPTAWTILQLRDALMPVATQGTPHPLWKPLPTNAPSGSRPRLTFRSSVRKIIGGLAYISLSSLNRIIDAFSLGESFVLEVTVEPADVADVKAD